MGVVFEFRVTLRVPQWFFFFFKLFHTEPVEGAKFPNNNPASSASWRLCVRSSSLSVRDWFSAESKKVVNAAFFEMEKDGKYSLFLTVTEFS